MKDVYSQGNGNSQLNGVRNDFNNRVNNKYFLGRSTRIKLNDFRRYRTI